MLSKRLRRPLASRACFSARLGNVADASRDDSVAKRPIILEQSLAHQPDQVEAKPPVLMVEFQDLLCGHDAQFDLGLADRRVHPLMRRREEADLSEHRAGADLDLEIKQSDRAAEHQVEFLRRIAASKQ